jgi:hypothetical protein
MEMMNYWEGKSSNCSMPFSNKREYGLCILTTYPMQDWWDGLALSQKMSSKTTNTAKPFSQQVI